MSGLRRVATPALIAAGAICVLLGVASIYANRAVFDSHGFADRAANALGNADVRAAVAGAVTDAVVKVVPDAVAYRPLISGVVDGVIATPAFQGVFRSAVDDVHRTVFKRSDSTVTLTLVDVGLLLTDALEKIDPGLAEKIPQKVKTDLLAISEPVRASFPSTAPC